MEIKNSKCPNAHGISETKMKKKIVAFDREGYSDLENETGGTRAVLRVGDHHSFHAGTIQRIHALGIFVNMGKVFRRHCEPVCVIVA